MDKNLFISHDVVWKMEKTFFDSDTESPIFSLYGIQWKLKLQTKPTQFEIHLTVANAPRNYLNVSFSISSKWKRGNGKTSSQDTVCVTICNLVSGKTKKLYENTVSGLQNAMYEDSKRSCCFASCFQTDSLYFVCSIKPDDNGQASLGLQEEQFPILSLPCADNLALDFEKALRNPEYTDVTLKCGDESFPAHKAILSCRSEVFQAMFRNDLKESQEGIVNIADIEPKVFEQLIHYIYTGNFTGNTVESMCDIYRAAHKYEIKALKERCIRFIKRNLETHEVCEALIMADTYLENDLKMYIITYIINRKDFLLSEKWQTFSKDHPYLAQEVFLQFVQEAEIKPIIKEAPPTIATTQSTGLFGSTAATTSSGGGLFGSSAATPSSGGGLFSTAFGLSARR